MNKFTENSKAFKFMSLLYCVINSEFRYSDEEDGEYVRVPGIPEDELADWIKDINKSAKILPKSITVEDGDGGCTLHYCFEEAQDE